MKCPRCKTDDVYLSQSGGSRHVLSFLMVAVRCHRCCHLFSVPRWKDVRTKPPSKISASQIQAKPERRAA